MLKSFKSLLIDKVQCVSSENILPEFFSSPLYVHEFFLARWSCARIFFLRICTCRMFFFKITHPPPQKLNGRPLTGIYNVGFWGEGKPEYPEKNLSKQGENQQQTQPTYDAGTENWTRATLVGGKRSHHSWPPLLPKFCPQTSARINFTCHVIKSGHFSTFPGRWNA